MEFDELRQDDLLVDKLAHEEGEEVPLKVSASPHYDVDGAPSVVVLRNNEVFKHILSGKYDICHCHAKKGNKFK